MSQTSGEHNELRILGFAAQNLVEINKSAEKYGLDPIETPEFYFILSHLIREEAVKAEGRRKNALYSRCHLNLNNNHVSSDITCRTQKDS